MSISDRVMRTLSSYHLVEEVNVDSFAATAFSDSMADQTWKDALGLMQVQYPSRDCDADNLKGCHTLQMPTCERQSTSKRETIDGPIILWMHLHCFQLATRSK